MKRFPVITSCEVTMHEEDASRLISSVDEEDHDGRVGRLVELDSLLPTSSELMGFAGPQAQWLFDEIKATWLYASFTSTVLTAHAFCILQLTNAIRLLPHDSALPDGADPDEAYSLDALAAIAVARSVVDIDLQVRLVTLHDRYGTYTAASLQTHELGLERHLVETQSVGDDHALLVDARQALTTAVQLLTLF